MGTPHLAGYQVEGGRAGQDVNTKVPLKHHQDDFEMQHMLDIDVFSLGLYVTHT